MGCHGGYRRGVSDCLVIHNRALDHSSCAGSNGMWIETTVPAPDVQSISSYPPLARARPLMPSKSYEQTLRAVA
jgi:hypothetical protein